jgi:short-subunit dehydrogenase
MKYKNKKILVTGGAKGIGKALVEEFIKRGATHIAIMGRTLEPMETFAKEYPKTEWLLIQGDLGKPTNIQQAVDKIMDAWGALDILVNNAGVVSASALDEQQDEDIINQININVTGLILMTQKALPLLKKSKEGAIINLSSGLGYIARPFYSVYAASKAAVRQFSDAMRRELITSNLHVMTIYPTATDTPMMKSIERKGMDDQKKVAKNSLDGLENGQINVIFGGAQRFKDIMLNFNDPQGMDEKLTSNYEADKEKTKNHRAM